MKVICAPDKFKESLTATQAAMAMSRGIKRVFPNATVELCPIADGGEGTVEALLTAGHGLRRISTVTGPLDEPIHASWGTWVDEKNETAAVIEMAAASGLALVPVEKRDPTKTTTRGTGELLFAALDNGAKRIIMGIGGSATTDGGCGAAQAVGVIFFDQSNRIMHEPITGGLLQQISRIDMNNVDPRITQTRITVACDVTNPLTGPNGAAAVYGPQKGATPAMVEQLDTGLKHLAQLIRRDVKLSNQVLDIEKLPGGGAAGGLGAGLVAFMGANIEPGVNLVLEAAGFDRRAKGCDLCLTGEGRLDGQSLSGKACLGVARAAAKHGVPTIALVGSLGDQVERTLEHGLTAYHVIAPEGTSLAHSMRDAGKFLEATTMRMIREWSAKRDR